MKTRTLLFLIAAAAISTVFSCSKDIEADVTPVEQANQIKTYTMSVVATKGEVGTKALNLDGKTLVASWAKNDEVLVYKGSAELGTLKAQSSGTSTTLTGQVMADGLQDGDKLTLKFLSPDYDHQDGTLDYIAAHCDYATAEIEVSLPTEGTAITVSNADFANQQAIVRFTLKEKNGSKIQLDIASLKIVADETVINVTANPSRPDNDVFYVAIPAIFDADIYLSAIDQYDEYSRRAYHKSGVTFRQGQYYEIGVKMSRTQYVLSYSDLREYVQREDEDYFEYLVLYNDIENTGGDGDEMAVIRGNRVIDLNGYTIDGNGQNRIFAVPSGAQLTLVGSGTLKGGVAGNGSSLEYGDNGGAIYNAGTLIINADDITITGNTAADGGGIYNRDGASATLSNVKLTGNSAANAGGAIYNNGTLNMSGSVVVSDNRRNNGATDNVYLESGKVITVSGAFAEDTSIGVTLEDESGVFTSGYDTYNATVIPSTYFTSDKTPSKISKTGSEASLFYYDPAIWVLNVPYLNVLKDGDHGIAYAEACIKMSSVADNESIKLTAGWYVVDETLTFNNMIWLAPGEEVNIILADNTTLNSIIAVRQQPDATLHIWAQSAGDRMGRLTANNSQNEKPYPGIGGGGYIRIHGGSINAIGAKEAPGIQVQIARKDLYGLEIYGGKVSAKGGTWGAGIGCGFMKSCGNTLITGGVVTATAGEKAAGIGAGYGGMTTSQADRNAEHNETNTCVITITGGDVTAIGDTGAGIGGGEVYSDAQYCWPAIVHIRGGKVRASTADPHPLNSTISVYPPIEGAGYANAIGVGYNGVSSVYFDYLDIYDGAKVWGSLTTDGSLTLLDNWNFYTKYKQLLIEPGS